LASEGYTGPADLLEGKGGFWPIRGHEDVDYAFMVEGLGKKWWIMDTSLKFWPCCRFIHHSLTAFERLIAEHDLKPAEMEKILIKGSMLYAPQFYVKQPKTPVNMQFSAPHSMAMLAFRRTPGPQWQYPETMDIPEIRELRNCVSIEMNTDTLIVMEKDLNGNAPKQPKCVPTAVEVTARGKVFRERSDFAKGDPAAWVEGMEMTDEELRAKYRNQAKDVMTQSVIWRSTTEKAIETLYHLERVEDISKIMGLFSPQWFF